MSVDPLFSGFPWWTPYQFAGNTPIRAVDLDGLEIAIPFLPPVTMPLPPAVPVPMPITPVLPVPPELLVPEMSTNTPGSIPGEKAPSDIDYQQFENNYEPQIEIPEMPQDNLKPQINAPEPLIKVDHKSGEQLDLFPKSEMDAQREEKSDKKFWVTYTRERVNENGSITTYSGRTSGTYKGAEPTRLDALRAIKARYAHPSKDHRAGEGFGRAVLDEFSTNRSAIRGRSQQLVDFHGGAQKDGGNSGNIDREVRRNHPKRTLYHNESNREFGNIAPLNPVYNNPDS